MGYGENLAVAPRYIGNDGQARAVFRHLVRNEVEVACIAYLARDLRVCLLRHIRGGRGSVTVPPRAIVTDALGLDAWGAIVAHNHPSGDPTPSSADLSHARTIAEALAAIEVRLLDSLIFAGDTVVSFRALGLL